MVREDKTYENAGRCFIKQIQSHERRKDVAICAAKQTIKC